MINAENQFSVVLNIADICGIPNLCELLLQKQNVKVL